MYWAPLADGYQLLVSYDQNPGDIIRTNPNGTLFMQMSASKAVVQICDASWHVAYEGAGVFEDEQSAYYAGDGVYAWDGRTLKLSIVACLDDTSTAAAGSVKFHCTGVLHNLAWVQGNLQFKPLNWDFRFHNEPYTWF